MFHGMVRIQTTKSFHEWNPLFNIIAPQALPTHTYWEQFTNV